MKKRINQVMEEEIRTKCRKTSKGRTIAEDEYCMKSYIKELPVEEASLITTTRLHMVKIPCNYGNKQCRYCNEVSASTEHYLECPGTLLLRKCWGITKNMNLICMDTLQMVQVSKFFKQIRAFIICHKNSERKETEKKTLLLYSVTSYFIRFYDYYIYVNEYFLSECYLVIFNINN